LPVYDFWIAKRAQVLSELGGRLLIREGHPGTVVIARLPKQRAYA